VKILVADDNPHVLALLQKSLQAHGEVEAFSDGADVLLRATSNPPDLIVTDYRMKAMDGKALVEKLKARSETKQVPIIVIATKADIDEALQPIADQVEEFITKPFFARDLQARAKRTLDKMFLAKRQAEAAAAGRSGGMSGKLSELNIMDLFQAMEMGAKTCVMNFTGTNGESAQIWFGDGQIYAAQMGKVKGDAVVNTLVKWPDGTFEINFSAPRNPEKNTSTGTQGLLMEALRLMDEENK
jgi:CheY-like chemotaxis protein